MPAREDGGAGPLEVEGVVRELLPSALIVWLRRLVRGAD